MSLPRLYIVRHAQPVDGDQMDPTREITPTGKKQAKMMGRWLEKQVPKHDLLLQSNMQRSQQTAKHIGKKLDLDPITVPSLDPDGKPEDVLADIERLGAGKKSVVVVSHSPLVQHLVAHMTGMANSSPIHFPHAAVAHLEPLPAATEARGDYTYDEQEMKRWNLGDGGESGQNCETCEENADMGWIDMDDTFLSTDGDDIDQEPAHPNCDCKVEFKTKRVRVYESGARAVEDEIREGYPIRTVPPKQIATLHSLVTPNVVARDEDDLKLVTDDSKAVVEAALLYVEALESEHDNQESGSLARAVDAGS